jgi:hypothetical protein
VPVCVLHRDIMDGPGRAALGRAFRATRTINGTIRSSKWPR